MTRKQRAFYNRNKVFLLNTVVITIILSGLLLLLSISMTQGYAECAKGIAC